MDNIPQVIKAIQERTRTDLTMEIGQYPRI